MSDTNTEEEKSKSQIKRELHELRDIGRQLVELSDKSLSRIPLSETVREEILKARKLQRRALQRQLGHIAGFMPNEDVDAIRKALHELMQPHLRQVRAFRQIEEWRDRLLAGDEELLNELVERFTAADRQRLRQLLRNAQKEREQNRPPKSARLLFQYLSQLQNAGD